MQETGFVSFSSHSTGSKKTGLKYCICLCSVYRCYFTVHKGSEIATVKKKTLMLHPIVWPKEKKRETRKCIICICTKCSITKIVEFYFLFDYVYYAYTFKVLIVYVER